MQIIYTYQLAFYMSQKETVLKEIIELYITTKWPLCVVGRLLALLFIQRQRKCVHTPRIRIII